MLSQLLIFRQPHPLHRSWPSGDEGSGGASSDDAEIERWAVWAAPSEIARRKAERARAKVPPEVRRVQVAEEYLR